MAIPCLLAACFAVAALAQNGNPQQAQPLVLRAEKHLVLVDTIVTDKSGNYIRDLTAKDFRVWEDKKEVPIETFSLEADPNSPQARKHYAVLFFDDSNMNAAEQIVARQAALKFLDTNTGPNRLLAVVNFGGSLQVAQNFTDDAARLKQVVNGVKFSALAGNGDIASTAGAQLSNAASQFGARDVLLALRTLAKGMANVPGRKTLIFLSSGFALDSELLSELTAVIDVCNKSNVAVYPIDVRGLVAAETFFPRVPGFGQPMMGNTSGTPHLRFVSYLHPAAFAVQHGGGSTSGGGGARGGSGGSTGGRAGGGSASAGGGTRGGGTRGAAPTGSRGITGNNPFGANTYGQPRSIVPPLPNVTKNQDVLYALATGTGGFVILNSNDLLGGLLKIGNEQNQYYVLGYAPPDRETSQECREVKVKVDRGGANVRSRSGYCTTKPLDLLAGTRAEKDLEAHAQAGAGSDVAASMELPFFYSSPNTARVDVALDIPPAMLKFAKQKGKLHSEMNVLGLAVEQDGSVAARFSDTVKLDFDDKKQLKEFEEHPYHYDNQFEIASGHYTLKVAFGSGGENFGNLQMPLVIDPYDSKKFSLSGVAFSKDIHKVSDLDVGLDAALLDDRKPLVAKGLEFTPSGSHVFEKSQPVGIYLEIYDPLLLSANAPKVGLDFKIIDRATGQQTLDTGSLNMDSYVEKGNALIPVALRLPLDKLAAGSYRAEFESTDSAGNVSVVRSADFRVQ